MSARVVGFTHTVYLKKRHQDGALKGLLTHESYRVCSEAQARKDVVSLRERDDVELAWFLDGGDRRWIEYPEAVQ